MTQALEKLSPAKQVEAALTEKGITLALINGMKDYESLTVTAHIDENDQLIFNPDELKKVKDARIKIKNTRVLIEKTCKEGRDEYNALAAENMSKQKEFVGLLTPTENKLQAEEDKVENLKKQIKDKEDSRMEERLKTRVDKLILIGANYDGSNYLVGSTKINAVELKMMRQETFNESYDILKSDWDKEQLRLAEVEAARKLELQNLAKQKAEQEAAQKEIECKQVEIKDAQERIRAENERIALAEIAASNKIKRDAELEQAKKEAAAKALKDAEEKQKQDALAKAEKERLAAEKEQRRLLRQSDKKLLFDFADNITFNSAPPDMKYLKSDGAKQIVETAKKMFKDIENYIKTELEKL